MNSRETQKCQLHKKSKEEIISLLNDLIGIINEIQCSEFDEALGQVLNSLDDDQNNDWSGAQGQI